MRSLKIVSHQSAVRVRQLKPEIKRQKGAALLILLTLIVLAAVYVLVTKIDSISSKLIQNQTTVDALARAKDALIGFALTYAEQHPGQPQGFLPCPDTTGDGTANGACGLRGQSVMGRLPWRTLKLPPLRDGAGECLWYAVSGTYKNNPKIALTSDTDGLFLIKNQSGTTVVGVTPLQQAVAIVFSAGAAIGSQVRGFTRATRTECGSTTTHDTGNNAANYLDQLIDLQVIPNVDINNASGVDVNAGDGLPGSVALPTGVPAIFANSPVVKNTQGIVLFNDVILAIKPTDFSLVYRRMDEWVANRVAVCLDSYAALNTGKFPFASVLDATHLPDYEDDIAQRYGRIPNEIGAGGLSSLGGLDDTNGVDSAMRPAWPDEPVSSVPASTSAVFRCFDDSVLVDTDWEWWWWSAWKEMVFIGIDVDYAPGGTAMAVPGLRLDGVQQAGVVLVAGRRLATQSRVTALNKADIHNYLEAENAIITDDSFVRSATTPIFNDVVVAVTSVSGG